MINKEFEQKTESLNLEKILNSPYIFFNSQNDSLALYSKYYGMKLKPRDLLDIQINYIKYTPRNFDFKRKEMGYDFQHFKRQGKLKLTRPQFFLKIVFFNTFLQFIYFPFVLF